MTKNHYADLRAFIKDLEGRSKLYRLKHQINTNTQLMPLMRLQHCVLPDEARQAFLH